MIDAMEARDALSGEAGDAAHPHRRHGRRRVMLSARLHTPQGMTAVALLDLSEGGAMASAATPLAKGSHVVLVRGALEAHGEVVWSEGRRFGIRFDEPVDPDRIEAAISPAARIAH